MPLFFLCSAFHGAFRKRAVAPSASRPRPASGAWWGAWLAISAGVCGCSGSSRPSRAEPPVPTPAQAPLEESAASSASHERQLDGHAFPDHVLALTWDDGPDVGTLALAEYLARRKVSATFFVIAGWATGLSSDPGMGSAVYATGYERIPILPDLLRLGHRLGNHTAHHVLLSDADPREAAAELAESQRALDPLLTNELRLFRAPGGAWSATAAEALSGDPLLADLVGPVRWDVDRKDWEGSLWCRSDHPATECEPSSLAGRMRVKPRVTAERYLASIEEAKHGIVLLHDRVGHVGSDYAIEVARVLVPALEARGYVFAAPVLAFSALAPRPGVRLPSPLVGEGPAVRDAQGARTIDVAHALPDTDPRTLRFGDLNGDGRADACARGPRGVSCTLATPRGFATASPWMQQGMTDADGWSDASAARIASLGLVDVNGDGRADLCAASATGDLLCGLAP